MRSLTCFLAMLLLAMAAGPAAAQEGDVIGYVKTVSGEASVQRGDTSAPAEAGAPVYRGDVLRTGPDGALGVTLKDSTRLSLGGGSELTLQEFAFLPSANERAEERRVGKKGCRTGKT